MADSLMDPVVRQQASAKHPALEELFKYPFMSALTERRTRRIARGTSINAGPVSWESKNAPAPIEKLEEAILINCVTGITGVTTHDGALIKPTGKPELGTPFLHIMARTGSSADNCQATHFFMLNDEGAYLLRAPSGRAALEMAKDLPPKWADWTENDWIQTAERCKIKVADGRLEYPREWPYYLGWNAQTSNVPGTTIFFPVVDCTWQYLNALLIVASEPEGKRPILMDDWRPFQPKGFVERMAKLASSIGIGQKIPYHPIGGLKYIRSGFVSKGESVGPLGFAHTLRTDYECFFYFQNLMLLGQAMGLGGWIHGSIFPPYIFTREPSKNWLGLPFRFQQPKQRNPMPPVPASQPNPVGIDGVLQGLCPPYVESMDTAIDRVIDMKYSKAGGSYGDIDVFGRAYKNRADAEAYLKQGTKFAPDVVAYVKEVCNYIFDTYGRFPAHVDAFYTPGMWLQFSHLEMEYYDRYFDGAQYTRQANHDRLWHR
jgi:hypothetical protein